MGQTASFIEQEKKTWSEHTLKFDSVSRQLNLIKLDQIANTEIFYLAFTDCKWSNVSYQHWFLTNDRYFIEFGSPSLDIYNARVNINTDSRDYRKCNVQGTNVSCVLNEEMIQRVKHVLGVSNYSLCLRNCEHVANYIIRGRWISSQMDDNSDLYLKFRDYLMKDSKRLINTFPSNIRPHIFKEGDKAKLYSFINDNFAATQMDYYLDYNEDTYNILVVGPTGAGKSHLINVLFNQKICDSEASLRSVTREIYFIRGRGEVYDIEKKKFMTKNIIVADTIGLCDTQWEDSKVIDLIKGRVSKNFKKIDVVYVVFRADRLLKIHIENIKRVLSWLKYNEKTNSDLRFTFIGTYADFLNEKVRSKLITEFVDIFSIKDIGRASLATGEKFLNVILTGFSPEDELNDKGVQRIKDDWVKLNRSSKLPGDTKRILLDDDSRCNIL